MDSLNSNLSGLHLLVKENTLGKDFHMVPFPSGSVPSWPWKDRQYFSTISGGLYFSICVMGTELCF